MSVISTIYQQIFKLWRVKRFSIFCKRLSPNREESLLDVGGFPGNWTTCPVIVRSIDTLNLDKVDCDETLHPEYNLRCLSGDGCALPFPDKVYGISFSNSVIEHVGTWEKQKMFASELRRVGSKLWCQTPARACPIEPHYLAPFIHWLPRSFQRKVIRYFTLRGLLDRLTKDQIDVMVETTRLLTYREMQTLFPDCQIYTEYLLPFIPKSYVAIRIEAAKREERL